MANLEPDFKLGGVNPIRRCSRPGCGQPALATLTYAYAESTAVVGPLTNQPDPHSWDLCQKHSEKITAPVGWEIVRVGDVDIDDEDDLIALAAAVRENGRVTSGLVDDPDASPIAHTSAFADAADPERSNHPVHRVPRVVEEKQQRRAHLQVVPDDTDADEPVQDSVSVNGSRHAIGPHTNADKHKAGDAQDAGGAQDTGDERGGDEHAGQGDIKRDADPVDSMLEELRNTSATDFESLWPDERRD